MSVAAMIFGQGVLHANIHKILVSIAHLDFGFIKDSTSDWTFLSKQTEIFVSVRRTINMQGWLQEELKGELKGKKREMGLAVSFIYVHLPSQKIDTFLPSC